MAVPFETAVIEDLAVGYGTESRSMPGGGSAVGNRVNRGTIPAPTTRCGVVHVYPPSSYLGKGVIFNPAGSEVSTSGSTTSGLQEAITYACENGYDLHIHGGNNGPGGNGGADVYNIQSGTTLEFPAMQGKSITFDACTINGGGTGTDAVIRFDSFMMLRLVARGSQFVSSTRTGTIVLFEPRTAVPLDAVVGCVDSTIELQAVGSGHASPTAAVVRFKLDSGPVANVRFEFSEVLGGTTGIQVDLPGSGQSFAYNVVECPHIHGQIGTAPRVLVGESSGAANTSIRDNYWNLGIVHDGGSSGDAFYTRATRDRGFIRTVGQANTHVRLKYETQAALGDLNVTADLSSADQAQLCQDRSTAANNRVSGRFTRVLILPSVGSSPYTYPSSTDYQLLPWDHEFYVTGGTVSAIDVSHDNGGNWYTTGLTSGPFFHRPGMRHRITYSVAPTVRAFV